MSVLVDRATDRNHYCSRQAQLMSYRRFSRILALVALTVLYFLAGKLGLRLASFHASASPVWPPAGIALAALLLFGYGSWPAIFLGAFLVNMTTLGSVVTSLAIGAGNTLEAICGAWLVNRFANGIRVFDRPQDVFKFAFAAVTSTAVSPSIGVISLALAGYADWSNFNPIWTTWWLGDATGDLIFAPIIILWAVKPRRRWYGRKDVEITLVLLLLLVLGEAIFGGWLPISAKNYPVAFVCGPILIWMAFRMSPRETATGIFILSAIAIWGTARKFGPFVMETENQSLLILQSSTAVLTLTAMALAAAMAERRRIEAALETQKALVEAANRTKDNFLAMLSHELRTPLSPVLLAVENLQNEWPKRPEVASALDMIRRNIRVEQHLIDDLLDVTRISKGKLALNLTSVNVHTQIRNVVETCRSGWTGKKIQMQLDLTAGDRFVVADEARFQQIVWNLVQNAIKFSRDEGVVMISTVNESPGELTIIVKDHGIGIEPEAMERIFNPFEQGERSLRRRFGGLGLGLAISKSLAEAHAATLTATSEGLNRGATFKLTIKTSALVAHDGAISLPAEVQFPKALRILLVDDHIDTCTVMGKLLAARGHRVTVAHDMKSALKKVADDEFDVLISDVGLPDGSGIELMAKSRDALVGIAMSGFGTEADAARSLEAGFSQHLVKPITMETLDAALQAVMGLKFRKRRLARREPHF
jgi:signal transduction histidine kinase/ActR/RegA family two-component response regulator